MLRALLFMMLLSVILGQFIPARLRIVDSNKQLKTFLVRGNLPIADKKFQIEELKGNLSQLTGLKRYKLKVISFLNGLTSKETKNRYIEEKFFDKNKHQADYTNWIILGSPVDLNAVPNWLAKGLHYAGQVVDLDEIDELLEHLHEEIHGRGSNTIVYIHCSAGIDRTGYVAGAYRMKYLGSSLKQVMAENKDVMKDIRKTMVFNAEYGIQWYCYSLGRSQKECQVSNK